LFHRFISIHQLREGSDDKVIFGRRPDTDPNMMVQARVMADIRNEQAGLVE
jgi:hypothetical protein